MSKKQRKIQKILRRWNRAMTSTDLNPLITALRTNSPTPFVKHFQGAPSNRNLDIVIIDDPYQETTDAQRSVATDWYEAIESMAERQLLKTALSPPKPAAPEEQRPQFFTWKRPAVTPEKTRDEYRAGLPKEETIGTDTQADKRSVIVELGEIARALKAREAADTFVKDGIIAILRDKCDKRRTQIADLTQKLQEARSRADELAERYGESQNDRMVLINEVDKLRKELDITDQLRAKENYVLSLIPPCLGHGPGCLPHAENWIRCHTAMDQQKEQPQAGKS